MAKSRSIRREDHGKSESTIRIDLEDSSFGSSNGKTGRMKLEGPDKSSHGAEAPSNTLQSPRLEIASTPKKSSQAQDQFQFPPLSPIPFPGQSARNRPEENLGAIGGVGRNCEDSSICSSPGKQGRMKREEFNKSDSSSQLHFEDSWFGSSNDKSRSRKPSYDIHLDDSSILIPIAKSRPMTREGEANQELHFIDSWFGSPKKKPGRLKREEFNKSDSASELHFEDSWFGSSNDKSTSMKRENMDKSEPSYDIEFDDSSIMIPIAKSRPLTREGEANKELHFIDSWFGSAKRKSGRLKLEDLDKSSQGARAPDKKLQTSHLAITSTQNKSSLADIGGVGRSSPQKPSFSQLGHGVVERDNEKEKKTRNDLFLQAKKVELLNLSSFHQFLGKRDLSLVMFYNSRFTNADQDWYKNQFIAASDITVRPNHAYAAIDCGKDEPLCRREAVMSYPTLKLYSKGQAVGSVKDKNDVTPVKLKAYVERWPNNSCC